MGACLVPVWKDFFYNGHKVFSTIVIQLLDLSYYKSSANIIFLKDVKKFRSAIYYQIWKHAKQNIIEYFAFSIHRWSPVILHPQLYMDN